jgi:hypothetical protein
MKALRALLSSGEYSKALAKGKALLNDYPDEFELKEVVEYAQGEAAQQDQKQQEKSLERQISRLMDVDNYKEAEAVAKRAMQELPKVEIFRKLAEDAAQKRATKEQNDRTRQELKRRIDEISGNLKQDKIGDAIQLAEETLVTFGPDSNVTLLLNSANAKQEEKKKKDLQEQHLAEAGTMLSAGNFSGATQLLNQAMATQIFERSDPRVQQRLKEIDKLSGSATSILPADKLPAPPTTSAPTEVRGAKPAASLGNAPPAKPRTPSPKAPAGPAMFSESVLLGPGPVEAPTAGGSGSGGKGRDGSQSGATTVGAPTRAEKPKPSKPEAVAPQEAPAHKPAGSASPDIAALLRKPAVLIGAGAVVVVILAVALLAMNHGPSKKEQEIEDRAKLLWSKHQFDESEHAWRELEAIHGSLQKEATQQIQDIENKRTQESQRFQQGENLLNNQPPDVPGAEQAFNDVVQMSLWLSTQAAGELDRAKIMGGELDVRKVEQQHFDQGKAFYDARNYDQARTEFQAARELNVPNSTLRPEIDSYLKKMSQNADAEKLYKLAVDDMKKENWEMANHEFQELIDRKSAMSGEAKKRLEDMSGVQRAQDAFHKSMQTGGYLAAKSQLDSMQQWPKTQDKLRKEMQTAERQEVSSFQQRANAMQANGDIAGMESLQGEVRKFEGRAEDPSLVAWAKNTFDPWLVGEEQKIRDKQGDKAAFDAAVTDFNKTRQNMDVDRMQHDVLPKFQKIAKGSGQFHSDAQLYSDKTIPAAIAEMQNTIGKGRVLVPGISCSGGQVTGGSSPSLAKNGTCAQLDADAALQWIGRPTIEMPPSANQPGKLPYTLELMVFVDATGKVTKVEKIGDAEKDFLKKAKESSKDWRTTVPKAGGKAVGASFPVSITFR